MLETIAIVNLILINVSETTCMCQKLERVKGYSVRCTPFSQWMCVVYISLLGLVNGPLLYSSIIRYFLLLWWQVIIDASLS